MQFPDNLKYSKDHEWVRVEGDEAYAPESVNEDPYGKGWMVKMKVADPSELDGLMDAAAYEAMLG